MILNAITKNFSKTTRVNPLAHRLRYVLIVGRMLKRPFSKAATSEDATRALRHVELLSEARASEGAKLADFFSIVLGRTRSRPSVIGLHA